MKKPFEDLRRHARKKGTEKEMLPLAKGKNESYRNQEICHIPKKDFKD